MTITPDGKDWTWVLERACPECGFDPASVSPQTLVDRMRMALWPWASVIDRPDVAERPNPTTWSPLEYAAHIRDVCGVMSSRLVLILNEDSPTFPNWDQDETARAKDYASTSFEELRAELAREASRLVLVFEGVRDDQWDRPGLRSNGSTFTAYTLGAYALHDLEHHLWDIGERPADKRPD